MKFTVTPPQRKAFPPGGWRFRDADTGWDVPQPFVDNFDATVLRIVSHRLANKLDASYEKAEQDLADYTGKRLLVAVSKQAGKWVSPADPEAAKAMAAPLVKSVRTARKKGGCGTCGKRRA